MSTAVSALERPAATAAAPVGTLLRAEAHRLRSRRLVRVLLVLGALGLLAAVVVASTQFARPSAAGLAEASARRQSQVDQQHAFRQQCLAAPPEGRPAGVPPEQFCGPELSVDDVGRVQDFVDKRPFVLQAHGRAGVVGVGAVAAAVAFLLGATFVGAEWTTRSMVALLFWEPRRPRVLLAKLAVLAAAVAVVGVLAEAGWLVGARVLDGLRGDPAATAPPHVWHDLLTGAGRGALLALLVGLLGFGLANLLRSTAAAMGVGFVYFAVLENIVRAVRPHLQPYLLTNNAAALLLRGGQRLFYDEGFVDSRGFYQQSGREQVLSNLHGGLVLAVVAVAVVGVGAVLFSRRDLG